MIAEFDRRLEDLSRQHRRNFEIAKQEISAFIEQQNRAASSYGDEYLGLLRIFYDHIPEICEQIKEEIDQENKPGSHLSIHFRRFSEIGSDSKINPFRSDEEGLAPMLQVLYRPGVIRWIESKVGVDIRHLRLTSQANLLRFLAGSNEEQFQKLQKVSLSC